MENVTIETIRAAAYRIPTERPESDGTLKWDATTMVAVHVSAGGEEGFGYTFAHPGAISVIRNTLAERLVGTNAMDVPRCWSIMTTAVRNFGECGLALMAVSAVDIALWDLKAKLLDLPLARLWGCVRDRVPIYGSGGFTSYPLETLQSQLGGWVAEGIPQVKMKIGRNPAEDPQRIRAAREAIGPSSSLFVDANGGYDLKQAVAMADILSDYGVSWFEEPVSQRDTEGLRFVREKVPSGMEVTAGEYGYLPGDFLHLLASRSVDVLMADATRCGISGYLRVAALCDAFHIPLSTHCAPAIHLHPSCALAPVRHMEYFYDHVRIEALLLDGPGKPVDGCLIPDFSRPGHGLALKATDADSYQI